MYVTQRWSIMNLILSFEDMSQALFLSFSAIWKKNGQCVQASHFTTERYDFAFSYAIIYSLLSHLTPARTFRQQLECQVPIKNNFGKFELFEPLVTLKIASSLIIQLFTTHTCFYTRLLLNRPHTLKSTMSTSGVWNQLASVVKDNDNAQFIFKRLYKCPRLLNEQVCFNFQVWT